VNNESTIEVIHDGNKLSSFLQDNSPELLEQYIKRHKQFISKEYPDHNIDIHVGEIDCNTIIKMNDKTYRSDKINGINDNNFIPEDILFLEDQIDLCNL